jgi:hypothetical protein
MLETILALWPRRRAVYQLSLRRRSGTICDLKWRTIHQGTTWRLGRGIAFPQLGHLPRPIKTLNPSCMSLPHPSHIGGCENSSTISDAFDIGSAILYGWPSYKTPSLAESTAVRLARLSPHSPDGTHLGPTARPSSPRGAPESQHTTEEFESQAALNIPPDEPSSSRVAIAGEAMNDRASEEERRHPAYVAFLRNSRQFYALWVPLASLAILLAISRFVMHEQLPDWVMLGYYFSIAAVISLMLARARYGRKAI